MGGSLVNAVGIGTQQTSGPLCVCRTTDEVPQKFRSGDVLVVPYTTNDMLPYLRETGTLVVSSHPVMPVTAALAGTDYTGSEMVAYLRREVRELHVLDGAAAAREVGSPKALNVIMLGAALASGALDFLTEEDVCAAIRQRVKPQFVEMNERALRYAREHGV